MRKPISCAPMPGWVCHSWNEAIDDLQRYLLLRPGLIDSYVHERLADAQMALGMTEAALENYGRAINAKRPKVPLLILREKLARIDIEHGRYAEAVAQYDAILTVARNAPYRADIALSAAQVTLDNIECRDRLGAPDSGRGELPGHKRSLEGARATEPAWDGL